jgi:hypothetical protein
MVMTNETEKGKARGRLRRRVSVKGEAGRWVIGLPLDPEREGERMAREVISEAKRELGLESGRSKVR